MRSITQAALAAASIAGALAFAPLAAHAGSYAGMTRACSNGVSTVGAALDGVEAAIYSASFTNARDQTNMLGKVREAASKASVAKWDDAIGKLQEVSDKADVLASAAKPKLIGADAIMSAAYAAQGCLLGL